MAPASADGEARNEASAPHTMPLLDGVRGFAILAVMVEHWAGRTIASLVPIGPGRIGVSLFFVLSGFLITGILLKARDSRQPLAEILGGFYAKRALRLFPAFYLTILVLVLLGLEPVVSTWPWHIAYMSNVLVSFGGPSSIFWTLAVEEQFYILWPFVLLLTPRRYIVSTVVFMILLSPALKVASLALGAHPNYRLLHNAMEPLGFGCLLAILSRGRDFGWYAGYRKLLFDGLALIGLIVGVAIWATGRSDLRAAFIGVSTAAPFAWLVMQAARDKSPILRLGFGNPAIRYVGQISYGLYLVHSFVPTVLRQFYPEMPMRIAAPLTVVITFGVCTVSWFLLERPIVVHGRVLIDRLSRRKPAASTERRVQPG